MPQRFGDFATWTGSIGTLAAFGIAYWQIHKERGYRLRREMADRVAARREHADRVSSWITGGEVVISNTSGHPIHDVDLTVGTPGAGNERTSKVYFALVPPGESRDAVEAADPGIHVLHMEFTDTRGDRWSRETGGHPVRVHSDDSG